MTQSPSLPELPKPAELLPCPFCGGAAHCHDYRGGAGYWQVECQDCDATTDGRRIKSDAIEVWNRRTCYEAGSAAAAQAVPGFVLVPRKPTEAMEEAGEAAFFAYPNRSRAHWAAICGDAYRAMLAAAPTQGAEGAAPQAVQANEQGLRDKIADLFKIGRDARNDATILANVKSAMHLVDCLMAVERALFTTMVPDEDGEEGDEVEECSVNSWGSDPAQYVEQVRAALTPSPTPTAPQEADALREADTPWQLIEMARQVSAAYRDGMLTGHEIRYLDTMIERAEKLPTAARDVLAERRRQVSVEGWTPAHDDEHADGALAAAAGCYARLAAEAVKFNFPAPWVENIGWTDMQPDWPWGGGPKPAPLRRMLVKAGALILAEIERLDRAALAQHQPQQGEAA